MARPVDLQKLHRSIEILMDMVSDLDMEVFELRAELRKKKRPDRGDARSSLAIELIAN